MVDVPMGDLSRAVVHEIERPWPDQLVIIARWGDATAQRVITKDEFYGLDTGAPISGAAMVGIVERLVSQPPDAPRKPRTGR